MIVLVGLQPVAAQNAAPTVTDSTVVEQGSLTITLNATGSLAPIQELDLAFELSAPITEILVSEGQHVKAGDVLAKIKSVDAEAALRNAQIALAQAQAAYDNLTTPPRDVDLAVAEAQVTAAKAGLYAASQTAPNGNAKEIARLQTELAKNQLWQSQLNRDLALAPNPEFRNGNGGAQAGEIGANSQVASQEYNVEIQNTAYQDTMHQGADAGQLGSASASIAQAEANLDNLKNPASAAELRRAQIDLDSAKLGVQKAQQQLTKTTLIAPIDGLVANENLTVGEAPPAAKAITLIDDSHYTIDLAIDETDIVDVAVGQSVKLNVIALKGTDITGKVTEIDAAPTIDGQLVTYTATVTLDFTAAPLRPMMSATATITTGEVKDVILVPNRFIRVDTSTQRTYVTVEQNGKYTDTPVTIGVRNETNSQIVSGLEVGQNIVLLSGQASTTRQGGFFGGPPGGGQNGAAGGG
jgi:HlyD family secretion protein